MKISIKYFLPLTIICLITLTTLGVIGVSYYYVNKIIQNQVEQQAYNEANNVEQHMSAILEHLKNIVIFAKELHNKKVLNFNDSSSTLGYFYEQLKTAPFLKSIYFSDDIGNLTMLSRTKNGYTSKVTYQKYLSYEKIEFDNNFIKRSQSFSTDSIDILNREWFKKAKKSGKHVYLQPYKFANFNNIGATISVPLYHNNKFIGAFGLDVTNNSISNFLNKIIKNSHKNILLLSKDNLILGYSDLSNKSLYNKILIADNIKDPLLKSIYSKFESISDNKIFNKKEFFITNYLDNQYATIFFPIRQYNLDLKVGIIIPIKHYVHVIQKDYMFFILFCLLALLTTIIISIFITNKMMKPITSLKRMAIDLKELRFNTKHLEHSNFKEIDVTLDAFNTMKKHIYETYLDTLNRLADASDYKDTDTGEHIKRLAFSSEIIAKKLGLNQEEAFLIKYASTMHDIGKIGIPDNILLKPGRLSDEERSIMQNILKLEQKF